MGFRIQTIILFGTENVNDEFHPIALPAALVTTLQIPAILIRHGDGVDLILNQQTDPLSLNLKDHRQIGFSQIKLRAGQLCIQNSKGLVGIEKAVVMMRTFRDP